MALLQKNKMTKRYEASRHVTMATESWSHTYSGFPRGNFFRKNSGAVSQFRVCVIRRLAASAIVK